MKKIIAMILCILTLISCFVFNASAEEEEEYQDISKESLLDCSTQWNYYSAPKYTIDGKIEGAITGYEFWRSDYSRNENFNINDVWIEYRYKEYKEIDTITLYVHRYETHRQQYILKVMVMGRWIEFPAVLTKGAPAYTNSKGKEYPESAVLTFDISEMVKKLKQDHPGEYDYLEGENLTTKKFRFYLKYPDQYTPPLFHETIVMGKKGETPALDVPDGAEVATNAALSGKMYASSSASGKYPAMGADNTTANYWQAKNTTDGEWIKAEFDKPYNLSKLQLDLCGITTDKINTFDVEVKLLGADGTWSSYATKTGISTIKGFDDHKISIFESTGDDDILENIRGIQVVFTNVTSGSIPTMNEIIATIADKGECIFLAEWMTDDRKASISNGNIAIYGTAYASNTFEYIGISETSYINDGQIIDSSPCWYAGTMGTGEYCGVKLALPEGEKATVNKVVLHFTDYITWDYYNMITQVRENTVKDDYVLGFEVQARKSDGTYEKIASGSSYDKLSKSYIVSFDFANGVVTDDIRVVFTSNDAGYAYIKEIEIYATDVEYGDSTQNGYSSFVHDRRKPKATTDFALPHVVYRAPFMDIISPLESK